MGLLGLIRKLQKSDNEARILVLGLDNAGKTTILKTLSEESIETITPTQGFNIKSLVRHALDQPGPRRLQTQRLGHRRPEVHPTLLEELLRQHRRTRERLLTQVFVIDSADKTRVEECEEELHSLISEEKLKNVPLLIFANKQDMTFALSCETVSARLTQLVEKLKLASIEERVWSIQACSAVTKEGLQDGMEWLVKTISSKK